MFKTTHPKTSTENLKPQNNNEVSRALLEVFTGKLEMVFGQQPSREATDYQTLV